MTCPACMAAAEALTYSKYPNDPLYAFLAEQWERMHQQLAQAGKDS